MKIEKLGQKHLSAIDAFACVETENELKQYVSKIKKTCQTSLSGNGRFSKE